MILIDKWLAHRQAPLSGDAHGKEGLPTQHDVGPWVQDVWEEDHIELIIHVPDIA